MAGSPAPFADFYPAGTGSGRHITNAGCWMFLERNLLEGSGLSGEIGVDVTFIVNASKGEETTTTVRLTVAVAIAKARSLVHDGWQVFITAPDGVRYCPDEFDKLLRFDSAIRSRSGTANRDRW
jgi:hypothetical protein